MHVRLNAIPISNVAVADVNQSSLAYLESCRRKTRLFPFVVMLVAVGYCLEVLPLAPPAWLVEGMPHDPIVRESSVAKTLFLIVFAPISLFIANWINAFRFLRGRFASVLSTFALVKLVSKRGALTLGAGLLCLFFVLHVGLTHHLSLQSYFVKTQLGIVLAAMLVALEPPIVLVLGSSANSNDLLELAAKHSTPLRTIHLFGSLQAKRMIAVNPEDNLRTVLGQRWRKSIASLIQDVPVLVLDARYTSAAVTEEAALLAQLGQLRRIIVVVNEDGSAPAPGPRHSDSISPKAINHIIWRDLCSSRLSSCRPSRLPNHTITVGHTNSGLPRNLPS